MNALAMRFSFVPVSLLFLWIFVGGLKAAAPDDLGTPWLVYGNGLAVQTRLEEAVTAYGQGIAAAPNDAALYSARGSALWRLNRRQQALDDLRRSLVLDPSQAALAAWIGQVTGQAPAAAPSQDDLEDQLSTAQGDLESRKLDQALGLFRSGALAAPNDAAWLKGEAETLYAEGRFDEARAVLAKARVLAPNDPDLKRLQDRYFPSGLDADESRGSVWGALWRSALVPGWGQAYNHQKGKAWTVGIVTLGLLAATVATYVATDSAIAHYRSLGPGSDFNAAFSEADDLAIANEVVGISFYTAYAWNVFDAGTHVPASATPAQAALPQPGSARLTLLAWQF
jgi:tetratricopeptide (TPR) repeat protein